MSDRVKASDVEATLIHRYMREQSGWAALREVTISDAVAQERYREWSEEQSAAWREGRKPVPMPDSTDRITAPMTRRIDLLLIRNSQGGKVPYERIAIEIKVSRSDFLRETPEKRGCWQRVAHRFAYAAPPGLIAPEDVPDGCGLLDVDCTGRPYRRVSWRVRAPRNGHEPEPMGDRFLAYLAGRAARAEYTVQRREDS